MVTGRSGAPARRNGLAAALGALACVIALVLPAIAWAQAAAAPADVPLDDRLAASLREGGVRTVEPFYPEKIADQLTGSYRELLASNPGEERSATRYAAEYAAAIACKS